MRWVDWSNASYAGRTCLWGLECFSGIVNDHHNIIHWRIAVNEIFGKFVDTARYSGNINELSFYSWKVDDTICVGIASIILGVMGKLRGLQRIHSQSYVVNLYAGKWLVCDQQYPQTQFRQVFKQYNIGTQQYETRPIWL